MTQHNLRRDPDTDLDPFRAELFAIEEICSAADRDAYELFLTRHYERLGFMSECVLPVATSRQFLLRHKGTLIGLFRLTPVDDPASEFFRFVPDSVQPGGKHRRLLELNNVLVDSAFRAGPALGSILYRSACEAHRTDYDFVVGLTRIQVLRFMVDFGVIPVDHPPLAIMNQAHLRDFVTYFETRSRDSISYMHERARRFFHQELVMRSIREKYLRPRSGLGERAVCGAAPEPVEVADAVPA